MRGRPTKYHSRMVKQAYDLCSIFGADDKSLASFFKTSVTSLNNWKKRYPEFLVSIKKGKYEFDSQIVEKALLRRALGYNYVEKTRKSMRPQVISGVDVVIITKEVTKYVPAEVKACIFWLKNRQPERWREKSGMSVNARRHEDWLEELHGPDEESGEEATEKAPR